jgi:hypothetical protein
MRVRDFIRIVIKYIKPVDMFSNYDCVIEDIRRRVSSAMSENAIQKINLTFDRPEIFNACEGLSFLVLYKDGNGKIRRLRMHIAAHR